jgi:endonuclease/exonuclease/phosphatase (EEP) superfamily protein YafD
LHLDQVWASGGRAHVRPRFGSDHRGIVADVWP